MQADRLIRELQSSNRLLKSELQATTTSFKQALHVAQTMLDTGELYCCSVLLHFMSLEAQILGCMDCTSFLYGLLAVDWWCTVTADTRMKICVQAAIRECSDSVNSSRQNLVTRGELM